MNTRSEAGARPRLTSYELEQVRRIAAWKSEPPNPLTELWKRITLPVARAVEKIIPDRLVREAILRADDVSEWLAGQEDVRRRAGVADIAELRQGPMDVCDRLAVEVGAAAELFAAAEGAATGAGGIATTFLDVPLLFILGLRTIRKIGHCYGYPLEHHKDRHFVLGVMIAALAGSLELRRQRLNRLRELEDLLIVETQEDILAEEALSFLFQIEIFEDLPGVGAISGAVFNWLFMRRVEEAARMVFQERWLRENGKVVHIEPAEAHARLLSPGWSGALNRLVYLSGYGLGFGVALPAYALASLFRPMKNALARDAAGAGIEPADAAIALAQARPGSPVVAHEARPALGLS